MSNDDPTLRQRMEKQLKLDRYINETQRYMSGHPDYDHWSKDDVIRETIKIMANDIGAAQKFLHVLDVDHDLYISPEVASIKVISMWPIKE